MRQGVTGQENQSCCVQCGKQGTDHAPLNRCGACKTSRYCSKGCQVKHRTVHKPVCMAIQELEKQKAAEDAGDDLNTTFPCHLTPRQQAGLTKLVGRRRVVKFRERKWRRYGIQAPRSVLCQGSGNKLTYHWRC